jgi:hypothetical protein
MKRFIEGEDRQQVALLPECLDGYIGEDNPVRVVDAFVEELDLQVLGFKGVDPASTGRPSYHPAVLLKLYIYGYLNRIQSSRRLGLQDHCRLPSRQRSGHRTHAPVHGAFSRLGMQRGVDQPGQLLVVDRTGFADARLAVQLIDTPFDELRAICERCRGSIAGARRWHC